MTGGVINTINTRLDAETVGYILDHGKVRVAIVDRQLYPVYKAALEFAESRPQLVVIDDPAAGERPDVEIPHHSYESLISSGNPDFSWQPPEDEWQAIALNYTSGTTGRPKGGLSPPGLLSDEYGHRDRLEPAESPPIPVLCTHVSL